MKFLSGTFLRFLLVVIDFKVIRSALSGIYTDDGAGQTLFKTALSPKEKNILTRNFRDFLGLSSRPKNKINNWSYIKDSSSHKYLLNIHNSIMDEEEIKNYFDMGNEETQLAKESDSVLALIPQTNYVDDADQGIGQKLWFDASNVPSEYSVVKANLRLYKDFRDDLALQGTNFTINVHHIVLDSKGDRQLELVDTISVAEGYVGWLVFNVSAPLLSWITSPSTNKGLHIAIQKRPELSHEHPHNMGIVSNFSVSKEKLRHPFMVTFLKADDNKLNKKFRFKRAINTNMDVSKIIKVGDWLDEWKPKGDNCKLNTLYLAFDAEFPKWGSDYLIAPPGVVLNYCAGECWWPLSTAYNSTNHAVLQALTNLIEPKKAPMPCCIPSILSRFSYVHLAGDDAVVMKSKQDVIAKRCACR